MIFLTSGEKFQGVINLELSRIVFAQFSVNLSDFDALVLTSKNSILSLKQNEILPNTNLQTYAISSPTAMAAREYGFKNIYISSNAHGNEFADEISVFLKDKKVLFLRAKKTASNVAEILTSNGAILTQIVAYESVAMSLDESQKPPKNSILIFTAPSNVKNFVQNFGWDDSYKCISIGKTTAKELDKYGSCIVSQSQNLADCVSLAKALF